MNELSRVESTVPLRPLFFASVPSQRPLCGWRINSVPIFGISHIFQFLTCQLHATSSAVKKSRSFKYGPDTAAASVWKRARQHTRKTRRKRFIDGAALPNLLLITPAKCITNRWHLFQYNLIPPALCHNLFPAAVHFYATCLTNFIIFALYSLDVRNEAVLFSFKYCWA